MPRPSGRPVEKNWSAVSAWARSGVMGLGGGPDGLAPMLPPSGLVGRIEALVSEIEELAASHGRPVRLSWPAVLAGRASFMGLRRQGQVSANGSCHLVPTRDGWMALNLPRPDDIELIPALVGEPVDDPWRALAQEGGESPGVELVARARLLGLAASLLPTPGGSAPPSPPSFAVANRWTSGPPVALRSIRVVDLSPLWAGPMVARVLGECGAQVTRLVSTGRHEGAAFGSPFYRWIHSDSESRVEIDLRNRVGRDEAARLIEDADVVIEGSRPRALEQLGLGPNSYGDRVSRVWLSVTGHGRDAPGRDWIAFGDDAAVAGGLVAEDGSGRPAFFGDAIADPLTGLTGAVAVLRALASGGGCLIDLAMARVAAHMAVGSRLTEGGAPADRGRPTTVEPDGEGAWIVRAGDRSERVMDRPASIRWIWR